MNIYDSTTLSPEETLSRLGVSRDTGLSSEEREKRLFKYGANEVPVKNGGWFSILLRQFRSPFTYLLFGAAILTAFFGEPFECAMILLFIAINTGLGFYQEFKSEKTLALLKQYLVATDDVLIDGKRTQTAIRELVPGDIIFFEPGDLIPADVRFIEANGLAVDESALTGESIPALKKADAMRVPTHEIFDASNIGFSGTTVTGGSGKGIILATGGTTVAGKSARLAGETERESILEKEIAKFSAFILKLVAGTLALVFLSNIFLKGSEADLILLLVFSIALAVSVIPEALPVVITFSLSRGAALLAKHKAVVKRLSAIEDLGGIEILCTDKTGTLTENILTVSRVHPFGNLPKNDVLFFGALGSHMPNGKEDASKNSFEAAIRRSLTENPARKVGDATLLSETPFDPVKRVAGVTVQSGRTLFTVVRGAPENIFALCGALPKTEKKKMEQWMEEEGFAGKRVFAIARKKDGERRFALVGLVSFTDPLKKTTKGAVERARALGVAVKILTGDSPFVAGAVARDIGLASSQDNVVLGKDFMAAGEKEREKMTETYNVFARVSPEQKFKIIQTLKKSHFVGFLGEGINDAPALKTANVALAVSGASDIAREASDIVLLQKSLHVIIESIEEGRRVYSNTAKYIRATLSSNFGNFYSVAAASFLVPFLPMLPLQILLLNILSDFPMIAVSTDNVDRDELHSPKSYNIRDIAAFATVLGIVSTLFDFIFFALFFREAPSVLQTNWFIGSVITELLFLFSIRTRKVFFRGARLSPPIAVFSFLALFAAIILPFTHFGQTLFSFTAPSLHHLTLIAFVALAYFAATECAKLLYYRQNAQQVVR